MISSERVDEGPLRRSREAMNRTGIGSFDRSCIVLCSVPDALDGTTWLIPTRARGGPFNQPHGEKTLMNISTPN